MVMIVSAQALRAARVASSNRLPQASLALAASASASVSASASIHITSPSTIASSNARRSLHSLRSSRVPTTSASSISSACLYSKPAPIRGYATKTYPPHTIVNMPALSPTMTQGNLGTWKKNIGDEISAGDVIVEIETDKAQMDMESAEEGFLAKVLVEGGTKDVEVNSPIAIFVENKDDVAAFADFTLDAAAAPAPAAAAAAAAAEPAATAVPAAAEASPSPATASPVHADGVSRPHFRQPRRSFFAASKKIPLEYIKGSGPHGRILKSDVESYKGPVTAPAAPSLAASTPAPSVSIPAYTPAPETTQAFEDIPLSNVRKVIASRLTESKQSIPHYYLTIELKADEVLALRETLNKKGDGKYKLSVNDFVIKAAGLALRDVPAVNSAWQGSFIREYKTSDIAVAVATENGLITPILTRSDTRGLSSISTTIKELATRARDGKLLPHEYQGGSFTISNLGMMGVKSFTAIINPPHAAILAVGGVEEKLVLAEDGGVKGVKAFHVTLSCDHRVVDGAVGALWLQKFKGYIENPLSMLL
ncbi:2-oxoacid dehydrogenases acyltransferase-domain-containing protein [Chytridium lagenaria]|nr:2-oxoacid dehydrogenases acyltransferase-domain-containing protein [Chytridium lagenaria]